MSRRTKELIVGSTFSLLFTIALAEIAGAALIFSHYIPASLPGYSMPKAEFPFLLDTDPNFGAAYVPDTTFKHRRACFEVTYRSNSYGTVDTERPRTADGPRAVVLGDSFAQGHGVDAADRFSNLLEAETGVSHMNFAIAGTGPTQQYQVYRHLAGRFAHDQVIISLLPDNDFRDDQPSADRYLPYWKGTYPDYTLAFSLPDVSQSSRHPSRFDSSIKVHDVLTQISFFYNVVDWVAGYRKLMSSRGRAVDFAGYFDFTDEEFLRLRYTLERLRQDAPNHRLTVVALPRYLDLIRFQEAQTNPLGARLTETATTVGFTFVDLMPRMATEYDGRERALFLGCDGHYSPIGHRAVADAILEAAR